MEVDLLKLLQPRYYALHIIVDGLFDVIQHGLIFRESTQGLYIHRAEQTAEDQVLHGNKA